MSDELGENYSTGVVCLPLSQERFIKERNNSNGIAGIRVGMGTENRYFFGLVRNWVNTELPVSFSTNDTVIDTCVVLSPYTSMLMMN